MKAEIYKPFLFVQKDCDTLKVRNLQGMVGTVKNRNLNGATMTLKGGIEVFVPRDAMKKV